MSGPLLVRERFAVDDRTFTVLGEPWFDGEAGTWRARLIYLPIDRSLPRGVTGVPLLQAGSRDQLLHLLRRIGDRDLTRVLRAVNLPLPLRVRVDPRLSRGTRRRAR